MEKAWLLAMYAEIEALKVEVEGMKALNQHRLSLGNSIGWSEEHFQDKANEMRSIANSIMAHR